MLTRRGRGIYVGGVGHKKSRDFIHKGQLGLVFTSSKQLLITGCSLFIYLQSCRIVSFRYVLRSHHGRFLQWPISLWLFQWCCLPFFSEIKEQLILKFKTKWRAQDKHNTTAVIDQTVFEHNVISILNWSNLHFC